MPGLLRALAFLPLFLGCGLSPLQAGINMFLKLGDIQGESTDYAHSNEVEVLRWNWGMSRPTVVGGGSGKAFAGEVQLTKWVDRASPALMKSCAQGKPIPSADLTLRTAGWHPVVVSRVVLSNVWVVGLSQGGAGGEDRAVETVDIMFEGLTVTYTEVRNYVPASNLFFYWNVAGNISTSAALPLAKYSPVNPAATLSYTSGVPVARLTWKGSEGWYYQVWMADGPEGPFQPYGSPTAANSMLLPASAIKKFVRIETLADQ